MPEVRLIDANAAADKIMRDTETHADEIGIGAVAIMIAFARALRDETDFPTIEPEVRHGRWIRRETVLDTECKCSVCEYKDFVPKHDNYWFRRKFCPNCGARMYGGEQE